MSINDGFRMDMIVLNASEIASPSAQQVRNIYATYILNVPPYTRYRSDGTTLVPVDVAPPVPTGILRAASSFNRLGDVFQTGNAGYTKTYAFRIAHVLGSGDFSELRTLMQNWTTNGSSLSLPGNTVTFTQLGLEVSTTTIPITIGGSSTRILTNGEADVVGDQILPVGTSFPQGQVVYIRGIATIPVGAGSNLIYASRLGGLVPDSVDSVCKSFDPGAASCTNITGTGPLTFTGTVVDANPPTIALLGKFVTGDPLVPLGVGDSITFGFNDTLGSTAKTGTGWFNRSLYNGGVNPMAGFDAGIGSATVNIWTTVATQLNTLPKYCNGFAYNFGTNSFDNAANNPTALVGVQLADHNLEVSIRSLIGNTTGAQRTFGIGLPLTPRCVTAGFDTSSPATQTIFGAKWDISGDVDSYNTARLADVNVPGRLDAFTETGPVMRADPSSNTLTDYHKYAATAGSDGTHPSSAADASMATLVRTTFDAIPRVLNTPFVPPTAQLPVPFTDLGSGVVNINGGTFTRASTAWTKLASGLWASVGSGSPRSHYLGMDTAVGAYNGWLQEGSRIQLVTPTASIRDMTDASWVLSNMTTAKTATGIDGVTNSASTLTATAGNATALQTLVAAASSRTYSCWIKRRTGTGTINITQDGSAFTDITSQINSTTYTQVQLNASVLNASYGIRIVTNGDAIDVDFNQFEAGAWASTPIDTAGATRATDVLSYPKGTNLNLATGSLYIEASEYFIQTTASRIGFHFDSTSNVSLLQLLVTGTGQSFPSARMSTGSANIQNSTVVSTNAAKNVIKKMFMSWGPAGLSFYVDGVKADLTANGPVSINGAASLFYLGSNNGATPLYGGIRAFNLYNTVLTDAQGYSLTS